MDLASYRYDADDFGTYFAETPTYTADSKVYLREPGLPTAGRIVAPTPASRNNGSPWWLPGADAYAFVTAVCLIVVALRRLLKECFLRRGWAGA